MGGTVPPAFFPSWYLLNWITLSTIRTTAAVKKSTWKNWIMYDSFWRLKLKLLLVSPIFIHLFTSQANYHYQNGSGSESMVRKRHKKRFKFIRSTLLAVPGFELRITDLNLKPATVLLSDQNLFNAFKPFRGFNIFP
jgi:hypothetical protein